MSPISCPPLPADTAHAAAPVFGRDHAYMRVGDALSHVWSRLNLSGLESSRESFLAACFYPVSLATIFQYWEHLTDRQMSQATRTRIDVKYALHLPLNHPGIEASMLCAFRQHILENRAGRASLQSLINELSPFAIPGKAKPEVMQLVGEVCLSSRAEALLECVGMALEAVATCHPSWLKSNAPAHWYQRYHQGAGDPKLPHQPDELEKYMEAIGRDGWHLLQAIEADRASSLRALPEIEALRGEWQRQYSRKDGVLRLRPVCKVRYESHFKSQKPASVASMDGKEAAI